MYNNPVIFIDVFITTQSSENMLTNVELIRLDEPDQIFSSYKKALERDDGKSTLLIEYGDYYNEK